MAGCGLFVWGSCEHREFPEGARRVAFLFLFCTSGTVHRLEINISMLISTLIDINLFFL